VLGVAGATLGRRLTRRRGTTAPTLTVAAAADPAPLGVEQRAA